MEKEPWYAVKCLFHHKDLNNRNGKNNFEERILLVKAGDFDEAIEKAEIEAKEYCSDLGDEVEYMDFCNAYHIAENSIGDKTEIYSLITASELTADNYLKCNYETGGEMTEKSE